MPEVISITADAVRALESVPKWLNTELIVKQCALHDPIREVVVTALGGH